MSEIILSLNTAKFSGTFVYFEAHKQFLQCKKEEEIVLAIGRKGSAQLKTDRPLKQRLIIEMLCS